MTIKPKAKILVTGGCGFVGHHFIEHLLKLTDYRIVVLDKLSYASNGFDRLRTIRAYNNRRVKIITWDLCKEFTQGIIKELNDINYIIHFAAESHVDRSLEDSIPFIKSNVLGTANLLEYIKEYKPKVKMVSVNTDEVYGPAPDGIYHKETDKHYPSNPYSVTKSAQAALEYAFAHSFGLDICTIHCMNIFGERQNVEKFIPKTVRSILNNRKVILHAVKGKFSSRKWVHARNVADAILFLLEKGKKGECYNIAGEELNVKELANIICNVIKGRNLKEDEYQIVDAHSYRPGHDLRYSLDDTKIRKMGWKPPVPFRESLEKCIKWMIRKENRKWLK